LIAIFLTGQVLFNWSSSSTLFSDLFEQPQMLMGAKMLPTLSRVPPSASAPARSSDDDLTLSPPPKGPLFLAPSEPSSGQLSYVCFLFAQGNDMTLGYHGASRGWTCETLPPTSDGSNVI
jgi:hypothetical protein